MFSFVQMTSMFLAMVNKREGFGRMVLFIRVCHDWFRFGVVTLGFSCRSSWDKWLR
jgi:hypothetical protein